MDGSILTISSHTAASSFILTWVAQALLLGTTLAGLTWLAAWGLRCRARPALEAALWSIVLIKFLIPVGPLWSLPLGSVWGDLPVQLETPSASAGTGADDLRATHTLSPSSELAVQNVCTESVPQGWRWPTFLAIGYAVGALTLLAWRLRQWRALLLQVRSLPSADTVTCDLVAEVCRRLGVHRVPSARISDEAPAPFVMGLFRPLLVLPHRQLVRPDEFETVVVHEVAHLRRGDLLVRLLQWIAGTLLFFWPVVAWVNRRIDVAREVACDEWALRYGKLTAGEYARCLLRAVRPVRACLLAYTPPGMAANHTTIERRIDMILRSTLRSRPSYARSQVAALFLLAWAGVALTGTLGTARAKSTSDEVWPITVEAVKEHAIQLYNQVAARPTADLNGDGFLSYREKTAYLVALAMAAPEQFMEQFPYADRDHSGRLDLMEAHDVIRGITLIAYADRRPTAAPGAPLDLEFYHWALDAQEWLLDNVPTEPDPADLENIKGVMVQIEHPGTDHVRKLNHGAPNRLRKLCPSPDRDAAQFGELEANIATVTARLATETDPQEVAKLQVMLDKLETILDKLEGS
jgi:beta-lactamase regulating signal transducer with metallopeptidase domain